MTLTETNPTPALTRLELGKPASGDSPWTGQIDDVWLLRGAAGDPQIDQLATPIELADI